MSEGLPLVTFALFAYNQENYIREAVEAALAQNYHPLEIILSDDQSTDRTFEIIKILTDSYKGPHKITTRRSNVNRGLATHVNEVMALANGDLIVVAAGDDISMPNRVRDTVELFRDHPGATAVLLSADVINNDSMIVGEKVLCARPTEVQTLESLFRGQAKTFGASRAFRKSVFDRFGQLDEKCPTEDTPLLLRTLFSGESLLSSCKGIQYRVHSSNLSGPTSLAQMRHDAIYSQYVRDFSIAATTMSVPQVVGFYRWLAEDRCKRLAQYGQASTHRIEWSLLIRILSAKSIATKAKLVLLRKIFLKRNQR